MIKKDNCKVYTPEYIADFMIEKLDIDFSSDFYILEPAVGTGNIFARLVEKYIKSQNEKKIIIKGLNERFFAFDNDEEALKILDKRLCDLLEKYNIDYKDIDWKIECNDILEMKLNVDYSKITHLISNPPYLSYRVLTEHQREALRFFSVCKLYSPNIYYAFLEYILTYISDVKKCVVITPNSYIKGRDANILRNMIINNDNCYLNQIFEFGYHVFDAQVMVCVSVFSNVKTRISHFLVQRSLEHKFIVNQLPELKLNSLATLGVEKKGGNVLLSDIFDVRGSIATLNDNFFIIRSEEIITWDSVVIFKKLLSDDTYETHSIERDLLKKVHTSNKKKSNKTKFIIYPYEDKDPIPKNIIEKEYPLYYEYYLKSESSKSLYYGRNQNLGLLNKIKNVVPRAINEFTITESVNEVIVSGYSLIIKEKYKKEYNKYRKLLINDSDDISKQLKENGILKDAKYFSISTTDLKNVSLSTKGD